MNIPGAPAGWLLLVISLPSNRATPRMRVWRALKGLGAAVLRDGVYLLPDSPSAHVAFTQQAAAVKRSGGTAQVLRVDAPAVEQDRQFRALFDRAADYARILQNARKLKSDLSPRRHAAASRSMKQLRREYESIHATDYFPGPAALQAGELLAEVEMALTAPGEPSMQTGCIPQLNRKDYRGRTWATRARPWVDRLASAWLIKRFIDPKARIVWFKDPKTCPRRALGFDFDGAAFTHVGARVTFEVLLASFALEGDKGLERLGQLVHYLDVGGVPVPEAVGLETILNGARRQHTDDDRLLGEAAKTFDYLYNAFSQE
jgi:hypothetical protein